MQPVPGQFQEISTIISAPNMLGRSPGPAVGSRASGGMSSCQAAGREFDAARAKPSGEVRQETQRFVVASLQLGRLEQ